MTHPPVAIVHDYLTQRGGAERVVLALNRAFPDAAIFTSLYDPEATFPEFADLALHASSLNRIATLRTRHRLALPFLAPAFSSMTIDADVVICSSSGWAHGVRTRGRKVVYCHAPARWLYQTDTYLDGSPPAARYGLRALRPALTRWDQRAARTADMYLANSNHTREMIGATYGIDAEVVWPPHGVDPGGPQAKMAGLDDRYFLCVSRLLAYKHVGAVVEAFRQLPDERLVVVGTGPEEATLRSVAPANVRLIASVTDPELRSLYANARALVAASFEDFGLTPVEAAAFGTPTVALRYGGYLDTVIEGTTGVFFDTPTASSIADAVRESSAEQFSPGAVREHAARFDGTSFRSRLTEIAEQVTRA